MAIKASSIKGLDIFDISQSKNIEKAQDIVFNPDAKKIEAILINKTSLLSEAKAILINEVKEIGTDAIMVESEQTIKKESFLPETVTQLIRADKTLPKGKVMTENGIELGKVSDLMFDPSSGTVQEIEISQSSQPGKKTIKIDDVISISDEAILVKPEVGEEAKKESQEKGVQGAMTKITSSVKEKAQTIKENPKVKEMTQKVKEKTGQSQEPQKLTPTQPAPLDQSTENPIQDLKEEGIDVRQENTTKPGKLEGTFKPGEVKEE